MSVPTTEDPPAAGAAAPGAAGTAAAPDAPPVSALVRTRIVPPKGWQPLDLKELWRYRELTWFLALRDIKVRYKQTFLGVLWAVIQPAVSTFVFTLAFNRLGGLQGPQGTPYELWVFCAMIPWQLFATAMANAGNSLVGSQNLITKVYFPRLAVPISTILAALVDFLISFAMLLVLMLCYGRVPGAGVLLLPAFILLALAAAMAVGLWLSALNVQYRDFRYVIPFLVQIWFFVTPIIYPLGKAREKYGAAGEIAFGLNPMTGVCEGFRWAMLEGIPPPSGLLIAVSSAATLALLVGGLYYFRRMEQTFADVV